jgi:hypothetical protein
MFMVPYEVCCVSEHIKETLDISDQYDENPTFDLITINGGNLEVIVEFMKNYKETPFSPNFEKPVDFNNFPAYCNKLLKSHVFIYENGDPRVSLTSILIAATTLKIESLQNLIIAMFVTSIENKNLKEMFALFGIPEDTVVTQEEVEQLQKEYAYAFEDETQSETAKYESD